ncbi:insulin-like growth factor-binding protein complex acid labile subunit isoform X2 [Parasteatoda tepidariorum]|nr:SLIT and NTRK-like protein 2 isoform X2 [Parasteatoda tepidariorum]XP_042901487.1 SLIT and NTRK-like protein 2 isoform X2 [Parasteatoda tepidariorum]
MTLTQNEFKGFTDVKNIDLQGSLDGAKTSISNDVFHGLDELKYLSVQKVDISNAQKAFAKLSSLEVLYVIHCDIGYLKWEMLDGLKSLKELYLLQSGIKELYGFAFYGTPELRRLFLSHNDLFSVEADAFVGLLKLEYLDLSNNYIDHLSGVTFPPLPHLQWLELKHNPIKVIFPHCFQFLNGTQHLTLGHKQQPVHLMKFSFRGLYSLLYLHIPNIDNDALFEHMFYDLKSLIHLNLHGRIKFINNRAFNGAHKVLKKLVLRDCQIERVYQESFHGLENLHILDLSNNLLQSLPEGLFSSLRSIHYVLINNNKLKQVPGGLFQTVSTLKGLGLHNNPWNCSCQMQSWKESLIITKEILSDKVCDGDDCSEKVDDDLTPRCEKPDFYKHESVFHFINMQSCDKMN